MELCRYRQVQVLKNGPRQGSRISVTGQNSFRPNTAGFLGTGMMVAVLKQVGHSPVTVLC